MNEIAVFAGTAGVVQTVQIFTTVLTTGDNKMVVVPNGTILNGTITNYSRMETRRVDLSFNLAYDVDLRSAKELLARTYEQMGFMSEAATWRNSYLTAAQELRHGNANFTASTKSTGDMVKALSAPMLFDYMAIVMDKQALADRDFTMNVILPDVGEQHMLRVKNGVLLVYADTLSDDADVSITCPKNALFAILTNNQETVTQAVKVEGSAELLTLMMENMNQFPITGANPFNIIEP